MAIHLKESAIARSTNADRRTTQRQLASSLEDMALEFTTSEFMRMELILELTTE